MLGLYIYSINDETETQTCRVKEEGVVVMVRKAIEEDTRSDLWSPHNMYTCVCVHTPHICKYTYNTHLAKEAYTSRGLLSKSDLNKL